MKANAPAAERNKGPILDVLRTVFPEEGTVLEIASGSGQHAVHFAAAFPRLRYLPSDPSAEARSSIDAWVADNGLANVEPARDIDVMRSGWEAPFLDSPLAAILCINMVHIAPWDAALGLFAGARRALSGTSPLVLYGPYRFHGQFTAPSNEAFDTSLRSRDPSWGVRDIDDLDAAASAAGFERTELHEMPANNHVLVYRRRR